MPAITVFEFAQRIKDYVHNTLGHNQWYITEIIAPYSTRSKFIAYGYKVIPLFAGAIAKDENGKFTNCRINFDDLCTIVGGSPGGAHLPYINVYPKDYVNLGIFDKGVTVLHIDCSKMRHHKDTGSPYYKHETKQHECTPKLDKLNTSVIGKINERLSIYNTSNMRQMELQFKELIECDDIDDDDEPKQLDVDDMSYEYSDIEGGYKD